MSKSFVLDRSEDHTGLSGTGIVADGIVFPNGKVVVCWRGSKSSIVVWNNLDELKAVSCGHSKTKVVFSRETSDQCELCRKDLSDLKIRVSCRSCSEKFSKFDEVLEELIEDDMEECPCCFCYRKSDDFTSKSIYFHSYGKYCGNGMHIGKICEKCFYFYYCKSY